MPPHSCLSLNNKLQNLDKGGNFKVKVTVTKNRFLVKVFRQVSCIKTTGPIHTKFGMDIALTKGNSLGNFGGGTFKVKVTRGHVTKNRFLQKFSKFFE